MNDTTQTETETAAGETTQPQLPNVTLRDLTLVVSIIDAGAQRGAWRGEEIATIGELRNKINTLVQALTPKPAETPSAPTAPVASEQQVANG